MSPDELHKPYPGNVGHRRTTRDDLERERLDRIAGVWP
jgi:hypothetical protein